MLTALRRSGVPYQLSPGQLLTQTLVTSGTMTNRIDRLAKKGLVERLPDPSDRRRVCLCVSPTRGAIGLTGRWRGCSRRSGPSWPSWRPPSAPNWPVSFGHSRPPSTTSPAERDEARLSAGVASRLGVPFGWGCLSAGVASRLGWSGRLSGLARAGSLTGLNRRPGCRLPGPVSTVPVTDWPQTPAGLSGSRFLRCVGGAGPRRGTSSQTAWCGVSRFKAAVCAVCCGGTPTRPHPTVSYAANRRRGDGGRHR